MSKKSKHDKLCPNYVWPCCSWINNCQCQCLCNFIKEVRSDERKKQKDKKRKNKK